MRRPPRPYAIPNRTIRFQPADSPLRQGSYRALAATANHFARESHIDELARAVGVDPVELRLTYLEDDRLADVLRAAAERAGWRSDDGGRGPAGYLGIACGLEKDARVATCAEVCVDGAEASVTRIVTAFDCAAGAGETPIVCVAPAVANAVFAATGVRIRSPPLLPEGTLPLERKRA